MILRAYWVGKSIVGALDPNNALQVIARYESVRQWQLANVRELTVAELAEPVSPPLSLTVAEALEGLTAGFERSVGFAGSQLEGVLIWHHHDSLKLV